MTKNLNYKVTSVGSQSSMTELWYPWTNSWVVIIVLSEGVGNGRPCCLSISACIMYLHFKLLGKEIVYVFFYAINRPTERQLCFHCLDEIEPGNRSTSRH